MNAPARSRGPRSRPPCSGASPRRAQRASRGAASLEAWRVILTRKPSIRARKTISAPGWNVGSGRSRLYCEICPQIAIRAPTLSRECTAARSRRRQLSKYTSTPCGHGLSCGTILVLVVDRGVVAVRAPAARVFFSGPPAIPTARQPAIFASWPTIWPTAPARSDTTTVSPGFGSPTSKSPKYAVRPVRAERRGGRASAGRAPAAPCAGAAARDRVLLPAELADDEVARLRSGRRCSRRPRRASGTVITSPSSSDLAYERASLMRPRWYGSTET